MTDDHAMGMVGFLAVVYGPDVVFSTLHCIVRDHVAFPFPGVRPRWSA